MKTTINYSQSEAPVDDAVEDIKDYLGDRYDKLATEMTKLTNCGAFAMYCSLGGIEGFPVRAWYEHLHGQGSWKQEELDAL